MRDGFVFYRSFFECFEGLPKKDKLALFDALCNYALNDIEPELTGVPSAVFKLLKPQVDANNRRYENGCKGGRPKGTKAEPNQNQTKTKQKPKEQDKDKEQEQDKDKEQLQQKALGSSGSSGSDGDDFNIWHQLTPDDVDSLYEVYPESAGFLIDEVYAEVKAKKKVIQDPVAFILGYAKNVGWDDAADHFDGGY